MWSSMYSLWKKKSLTGHIFGNVELLQKKQVLNMVSASKLLEFSCYTKRHSLQLVNLEKNSPPENFLIY